MAHTLKLVQGGSTLVDFTDTTKYRLANWSRAGYKPARTVQDQMTLHILGATDDALFDNVIALQRALLAAGENDAIARRGGAYTPIYLQFQLQGASNLVQAELRGGAMDTLNDALRVTTFQHYLMNVALTLERRPYAEETALVNLVNAGTYNNFGAAIALSAMRGDLPAPLYVKVRAGAANQDRVIVALKSIGTVANFLCVYDVNGAGTYASRGANVADLSDANLSPGSGVTAQRWTPGGTSEQELVTVQLASNLVDKLGTYRCIARVRENGTAGNTRLRARMGVYVGSTYQWGNYGDAKKGALTNNGTTAIALIDCGILAPPQTFGNAPAGLAVQFRVAATTTGAGNEFDIDAFFLMPVFEGGQESGYNAAIFPTVLGTGATPDAVLDARDNLPDAYLDASGTLQYVASDVRGAPLFGFPNRAQRLFVLTQQTSNEFHTYNVNNTVTVSYLPRYAIARGT